MVFSYCFLLSYFFYFVYLFHDLTEIVEFNLSGLNAPNVNVNTQNTVAEQVALNTSLTSNSTDNQGSVISNLSHLSQPVKKESNLLSWFNFSSSNTSTSGGQNMTTAAKSLHQPSSIESKVEDIEATSKQSSDLFTPSAADSVKTSPLQSMKPINKTNFGEIFYKQKLKEHVSSQGNETNPNLATNTAVSNSHKQTEQSKPSRRTSSLLNLFMSNTQGNIKNCLN